MMPKRYTTTVIKNKKLQEDTFLLSLKLPEKLNFKAGQFVLVYKAINEKEINRAFSISSKPSQNKIIELLIKKYENGALSPLLEKLEKGNQLDIRGPFGLFLVKDLEKEVVFIAAGTGIAPLRSMILDLLEKNTNKKITLIAGFKNENSIFFKEEFENLQKEHKNFNFITSLSKPTNNWKNLNGRITEHLQNLVKSPDNKEVYICGPKQMINDTLNILVNKLNFKKESIHIERWGN